MATVAWVGVSAYLVLFTEPPNERPEVASSMYAAVVRAGDGGTVDMRNAAPFEWDRMYVFDAYTTDDDVSEVLGFTWEMATACGSPTTGSSFWSSPADAPPPAGPS